MLPANKHSCTSSFRISLPFFSCIFASETSRAILNRCANSDFFALFSLLGEKHSKGTYDVNWDTIYRFYRCSLSNWGSSLLLLVLKRFYHKWRLNFDKCFCCIYWGSHIFFSPLFCQFSELHWFFPTVKPIFHDMDKTRLIMMP